MNYVDHRINPRDDFEKQIIRACEVGFEILAEMIGLDDYTLTVQRQAGWAGHDAHHLGYHCKVRKVVKINLRNLGGFSIRTIMTVLGHEMRHAYQAKHNMSREDCAALHVKTPTIKFRHDKKYEQWFNRGEEQDAMAFELAYAQIIFNDPRFAEFDISGVDDEIMIEDKRATYEKLYRENDEMYLFNLGRCKGEEPEQYFMYASQFGTGKKKISKKDRQAAFTTHLELLKSQKVEWVKRPMTIRDICC